MSFSNYFDSRKTTELIGHREKFIFFKSLILLNKLPNVLLLSGEKGIGKSTLINHIMHYYFDRNNYDENNFTFQKSKFHNQYLNNIFPNIVYLTGSDFKNVKVDDVRILKKNLNKSSILNDKRFIILDDVETFNLNTLNGLLRIIEEPSKDNYFILINNKSKPLIETIRSRCIELKIILDTNERKFMLSKLLEIFNQKNDNKKIFTSSSPGNILKFNLIFHEKKIDINDNFLLNFNKILNLYKKEKNTAYRELLLFFTENYFENLNNKKKVNYEKIIENRLFIVKSINEFFLYNLNQNALLNSIENKLFYE